MHTAFLLSDLLFSFDSLADRLHPAPSKDWSYPPTDLIKTGENTFELHFALAGTRLDQIEISAEMQQLTLSVKFPEVTKDDQYIVKAIARRSFVRKFQLEEHFQVGNASFTDGLLKIMIERVIPESLKKRSIAIS